MRCKYKGLLQLKLKTCEFIRTEETHFPFNQKHATSHHRMASKWLNGPTQGRNICLQI
jgi:hypothetical protein